MKKYLLLVLSVILISLFINTYIVSAQSLLPICQVPTIGSVGSSFSFQGKYRTSLTGEGEFFRVLVIFARFAEDTIGSGNNWENPDQLPYWATHIVDSSISSIGSTDTRNISVYYNENSYGRFKMIGDVYYITLPHNETYYHQSNSDEVVIRGTMINDALQKLDTTYNVDFTRYDNWKTTGTYSHSFEPDGFIDMVWFITRSYTSSATDFITAAASLNLINAPLTLDGVKINHSQNPNISELSSGIMLIADVKNAAVYIYKPDNPNKTINGSSSVQGILIHEMSHYMFGQNHFGDSGEYFGTNDYERFTSYFDEYAANAGNCFGHHLGLEKYRLGWISQSEVTTITANQNNVKLYDIATTSDPQKNKLLIIDIPNTNQCFFIENRQWNSTFESRYAPFNGSQAVLSPGLLIYHVVSKVINEYDTISFDKIKAQIRSANGKYNWIFLYDGGHLGNYYESDLIDKTNANRANGYDKREPIYTPGLHRSYRAGYWPYAGNPEGGGPYPKCTNFKDKFTEANDNVGDKYNLFQKGDVFTPWSNPASHLISGTTFNETTIGVEVADYLPNEGGAFVLNIRINNAHELTPSKPQDIAFSADVINCQFNVSWTLNEEPDITGTIGGTPGSYKIYRSINDENNYLLRGSVQHPTHTYQDDYSSLNSGISTLFYRLKSVDNTNKESNFSDAAKFIVAKGTITSNVTTQNQTVYILGDVTVASGVTWDIRGNSKLEFCPGAKIYVDGILNIQQVELNQYNEIVCNFGGTIIFPEEAIISGLKTMIIENGGTLEVHKGSRTKLANSGIIKIYGFMNAGLFGPDYAFFEQHVPGSYWQGIFFDNSNLNSISNGVLSYLNINGAVDGIKTDHAQPSITNCYISNNANSGIYVIGTSPYLINNKVEWNLFGLIGFWMSTGVHGNRFGHNYCNGAELNYCGNVWYDNKVDNNYVGIHGESMSSDFNRYEQGLGNGVRNNSWYGVDVRNWSYPSFCGENAVYNNGQYDLFTDAISWIYGNGNAMPTSTRQGNVTWDYPIPNDPVESYLTGNGLNYSNMTDEQLYNHARLKRLAGEYSDAVTSLKELIHRGLHGQFALKGAELWYSIINDADFNFPNNDPVSKYINDAKHEFYQHMTNNIPMNTKAGRRLHHLASIQRAYSKEYNEALNLADLLISASGNNDEKIKYLYDKLVLELHGKKNVPNAQNVYQQIIQINPSSTQAVVSKMLLKIPFTKEEWFAAFGYGSTPSPLISNLTNEKNIPGKFELYSNYPNPFNPLTEISYYIPKGSDVKLSVVDVLGREIAVLVNEYKEPGMYKVIFNDANHPSGIYYYRLIAGRTTITRKMSLIR